MIDKVGIIGLGSMGRMLLDKIKEAQLFSQESLYVTSRTPQKIEEPKKLYLNVNFCKTVGEVASQSNIVFLCIKPIDMRGVLQAFAGVSGGSKHLVSLNASISFELIESVCPTARISKIIPSVTGEVNLSKTLICHSKKVLESDKIILNRIVESFGTTFELKESQLGMGSELTSCMPGFIASIFQNIQNQAIEFSDFSLEEIHDLISYTLLGTAELVRKKSVSFDHIIKRVATKGGITQEGVKIIDEHFPAIVKSMFQETIKKREYITETAKDIFQTEKRES